MVNVLAAYMRLLQCLMKLAGMTTQEVVIEPGTVIHFWVPSKTTSKNRELQNQAQSKSPNKPVVVFLHGFGFNGILTWQFQVLALAKDYAVYVPDFLFFGGSITDKADRSPAFQAKCIAEGLRKLGVSKCTLVGSSYGGMVGFKMADMYPDLVESMVINCSVMALTESISRAGLARIGYSSWAEYLLPDTVKGLKAMLDIAVYKLPWLPDFIYKNILQTMFNNRKDRTELLEALVISDKDFNITSYPQAEKIHLLWGEKDKIFNMEVAHNLKQQLEGKAKLHGIEKAGHLVELERPFVYNWHLKKILRSLYEDGQR